jgi:putative spermidine/putrescine transport system permease protein
MAAPVAPRATRAAGMTARGATVLVVLLAAWTAAPLLPVLVASMSRGWFFPDLVPNFNTSAYLYAMSPVSGVGGAILQSVSIAAAVAVLSVLVGVPAGRALALGRFRGKGLVETLVLAPALVPTIGVAMGLATLMIRAGLSGTTAGVILIHLVPALPYAVMIPAAAFAARRSGFEDVARTLGAGRVAVWRHVVLPMIAPSIALTAALCFLVSWSQVALTMLAGGGRIVTLPLILVQFVAAGRSDIAGVVAILTMVPAVAVLWIGTRVAASWGRA